MATACPLGPKEAFLDQNNALSEHHRDISGQHRDIFLGKGPCQTERWFFMPTEGPLGPTNSLQEYHKSLLGPKQSVRKGSFSA